MPGDPVDPRVARTRCSVIEATRSLLAEGGYSAVNIDAVSRRSGVARTTIYRHWPSIAALVHAAAASTEHHVDVEPSGETRLDIRRELDRLASHLTTSETGRLLPVLVDAAGRDPEILELQRRFVAERRGCLVELARAGVARGELRDDLDLEIFIDRLVGPIFFRVLVSHQPVSRRYVERLVDAAFAAP